MITRQYIPKGLVPFEPVRRESHRYGSAEMCGLLPNTLYKVLPQRHARQLLDTGGDDVLDIDVFPARTRPDPE